GEPGQPVAGDVRVLRGLTPRGSGRMVVAAVGSAVPGTGGNGVPGISGSRVVASMAALQADWSRRGRRPSPRMSPGLRLRRRPPPWISLRRLATRDGIRLADGVGGFAGSSGARPGRLFPGAVAQLDQACGTALSSRTGTKKARWTRAFSGSL